MNQTPNTDRRNTLWWTLVPALCGLALVSFLFHVARDRTAWDAANRWPPLLTWPVFGDLDVTLYHLRQADEGVDPLADPTSEFAYPRAVLGLRHLQLQNFPSAPLGAIQALVFMAAVIFILRPRTPGRALLTVAIFISPPIWMGLERANIDLLLFAVFVAVAAIWARAGTLPGVLAAAALTLGAALLKLYPAFALLGGMLSERGRRQLPWIGAIVCVLGYCAANWDELRLILGKFPVGGMGAWGCLMALRKVNELFPDNPRYDVLHLWLLGVGLYTVAFAAAGWSGHRFGFKFRTTPTDRTEWACYVLGTAICGGSFLASNYPYRWAFALLTLPMLLRLARTSRLGPALWARVTLAALSVSLVAPWDGLRVFFVAQGANWAFVLLAVFGFFAMREQHLAAVPTLNWGSRLRRSIWPDRVAGTPLPAKTADAYTAVQATSRHRTKRPR